MSKSMFFCWDTHDAIPMQGDPHHQVHPLRTHGGSRALAPVAQQSSGHPVIECGETNAINLPVGEDFYLNPFI